jgi:head-tail adaptor
MPSNANLGRVNLARVSGAGELRYRVTFFERDQTEDEFGNTSQGWVERFTVAANIVPRFGIEAVEAARLAGRQPMLIRVRVSPATVQITTDWLATDQASGKQYNIRTAVDPLSGDAQHGMYIDMLAETGVAV